MDIAQRVNGGLRRVPAWSLYVAGALPALWLFWQAAAGGLGPDPVKAVEHQLGLWGLQLMIAVLAVTPLRRFSGVSFLKFRRQIGLLAFYYIVLHFLAWIALDMGLRVEQALGDIVKRPYVTVGMAGLLALIPLALTSNNYAVRRLGAVRWQRLHRLTYVAALAGGLHFIWLVKAWPVEPFLYMGAIVGLLALRLIPRKAPAKRGDSLRVTA
jgi:methionine sulfoxide reductase heme-binding subunit